MKKDNRLGRDPLAGFGQPDGPAGGGTNGHSLATLGALDRILAQARIRSDVAAPDPLGPSAAETPPVTAGETPSATAGAVPAAGSRGSLPSDGGDAGPGAPGATGAAVATATNGSTGAANTADATGTAGNFSAADRGGPLRTSCPLARRQADTQETAQAEAFLSGILTEALCGGTPRRVTVDPDVGELPMGAVFFFGYALKALAGVRARDEDHDRDGPAPALWARLEPSSAGGLRLRVADDGSFFPEDLSPRDPEGELADLLVFVLGRGGSLCVTRTDITQVAVALNRDRY